MNEQNFLGRSDPLNSKYSYRIRLTCNIGLDDISVVDCYHSSFFENLGFVTQFFDDIICHFHRYVAIFRRGDF